MTSRVWTKPETQKAIKAIRAAGYDVKQPSRGHYTCHVERKDGSKMHIFTALIGHNGYLVRYHPQLFGAQS